MSNDKKCEHCDGTGRVGNAARGEAWKLPQCPHCDGTGHSSEESNE
jgi:DnaJ-class molecular chaperone